MTGGAPMIFVVDDNTSFLTAVARMFRAAGFGVKAYSSAREFLVERPTDATGCVVADLQMPDMNGIELQGALAATDNPLPVVFLTGEGDIAATVKAMRQGAEDFLTKLSPKEELLAAVRRALVRDARDRELRTRQHELKNRFARLTSRENEVLAHLLRGQQCKQIAADLGIEERSVQRRRASLMEKLQIQSVVELSALALAAGIAGAEPRPLATETLPGS